MVYETLKVSFIGIQRTHNINTVIVKLMPALLKDLRVYIWNQMITVASRNSN